MTPPECPLSLKTSHNCHSESRSLFERGEELCPIACFLREESAFSPVASEKQISLPLCGIGMTTNSTPHETLNDPNPSTRSRKFQFTIREAVLATICA